VAAALGLDGGAAAGLGLAQPAMVASAVAAVATTAARRPRSRMVGDLSGPVAGSSLGLRPAGFSLPWVQVRSTTPQ
jgi:hypothetical protein